MKISLSNYEIFFLDYFENNLSPQQVAELMAFLDANPDLKREFSEFELIKISEKNNFTFPQKQNLKKSVSNITTDNYQDYMISFVENELSPEQVKELDIFINQNPALQKDLNAFKKTKLVPDVSVVFPDKSRLKHISIQPSAISYQLSVFNNKKLRYAIAIAASFAILIGLFFLLNKKEIPENIAVIKPVKSSEKSVKMPVNNNTSGANVQLALAIHKAKKHNSNPVISLQPDRTELAYEPPLLKVKPLSVKPINESFNENLILEKVSPLATEKYAATFTKDSSKTLYAANDNNNRSSVEKTIVKSAMNVIGVNSLPTASKNEKRHKIKNFWDVAFLATKAYDKVFDKDAELKQKFDNNGNLVAVNFSSELIGFEKNVK